MHTQMHQCLLDLYPTLTISQNPKIVHSMQECVLYHTLTSLQNPSILMQMTPMIWKKAKYITIQLQQRLIRTNASEGQIKSRGNIFWNSFTITCKNLYSISPLLSHRICQRYHYCLLFSWPSVQIVAALWKTIILCIWLFIMNFHDPSSLPLGSTASN